MTCLAVVQKADDDEPDCSTSQGLVGKETDLTQFTELLTRVMAASGFSEDALVDTPYTIFVPNDAAFEDLFTAFGE